MIGVLLLLILGLFVVWASRVSTVKSESALRNAEYVDDLLPQTQCGRCGYTGCRPYADAIMKFDVDINRCPPGGEQTIHNLAELLGEIRLPLAEDCDSSDPDQVVVIDEQVCIGCTKCIQVCPVDAIVGASKLMHTVIAAECTGCNLCIPPCPVDCIAIEMLGSSNLP